MAASIWVEEESGTFSGRVHPNNGYYAADFGALRNETPSPCSSTSGFDA